MPEDLEFKRDVIRTMYPGSKWIQTVEQFSPRRVHTVYKNYVNRLMKYSPLTKKENP